MGEGPELRIGDHVKWQSSLTGWHHTGHVVSGDNGIGKVLVRPDERVIEWSAWEPIDRVTLAARPSSPLEDR